MRMNYLVIPGIKQIAGRDLSDKELVAFFSNLPIEKMIKDNDYLALNKAIKLEFKKQKKEKRE
jgi:hypothetical protein